MGTAGPAAANLGGAGLRIALVASRFNESFCERLLQGALGELARLGVTASDIETVRVPGALEIPMALQWLAQSRRFDALVALGAVVRGETYHFEIVSNESAAGITSVQLDTGIPIANGVLTCDTDEQAEARMQQKGAECAEAAVEMANLQRGLAIRFRS